MLKVSLILLALLLVTQAPIQSANAVTSVFTGLTTFTESLGEASHE